MKNRRNIQELWREERTYSDRTSELKLARKRRRNLKMERQTALIMMVMSCLVVALCMMSQAAIHPAFLPKGNGRSLEAVSPGKPAVMETIEPPQGRIPLLFDGEVCPEDLWDEGLEVDVSNTEGIFGTWVPPHTVTMWVKYDDHYIYFAFDDMEDRATGDYDQVALWIDDNGDQHFPPVGDDSEGPYWICFFESGAEVYRAPMYDTGEMGPVEQIYNVKTDICVGEYGELQYEIGIPWENAIDGIRDEDLNTPVGGQLGCWLCVIDFAGGIEYYDGVWPLTDQYDDPMYYNGTLRPFGPGLPRPDVWLKDCSADNGTEPSWSSSGGNCPSPWSSPDIWAGDATGANRGKAIYSNVTNKLYCEVRNRGTVAAAMVKATFVYTQNPHIHLQKCTDPAIKTIGADTVYNVPKGGSVIAGPVNWTNPPAGHYCLAVYLDQIGVVQPDTHFSCWPWDDNNVAARNYGIATKSKDTGTRGQLSREFIFGNATCTPKMVAIEVDRSELLPGWTASIDVPEYPDRFEVSPEGYPTATLTVTYSPDEVPGTVGQVTVIEYIYNNCNDALISQTGGFTVDVVASPLNILGFVPDSPSVARGEKLGYSITVQNESSQAQTFDAWFDAILPSGDEYAGNPVQVFDGNKIPGSKTVTKHLTTPKVPNNAPLGRYAFIVKFGDRQTGTVWNEDHFVFDVVASTIGGESRNNSTEDFRWISNTDTSGKVW